MLLKALADDDGLVIRRWFGSVDFVDAAGKEVKKDWSPRRATVATSARFGWIERVDGPEGDHYSRYRGDQLTYYALSSVGRLALNKVPASGFVVHQATYISVNGEAGRVLRALAARHERPEWVFITEAPAYCEEYGIAHVDALAIDCYHSEKYRRVGYEVKVSRGDFLSELKAPQKTARSSRGCSEFYFAVPSGLVKAAEVPDPYGLMNVGPRGGTRMAKRSTMPDSEPSWGYVATLLRRVMDEEGGGN